MQATALGRYLLYRPDAHVRRRATAATARRAEPGRRLGGRGGGRRHVHARPQSTSSDERPSRFAPRRGLRRVPRGRPQRRPARPRRAPTEYGRVGGLVEGHMHWMTYEYFGGSFHCGRPWHPYGIPYALPDCADDRGPAGHRRAAAEHAQLRQPRAAARHERLPEADRVSRRTTSPTRARTGAGSSARAWPACG